MQRPPDSAGSLAARLAASRVATLTLASALFVLACALARGGFFSSADPGDVGRYHDFADLLLDGRLPYRDFYMEYPPGAVPAFLAPALVAPGEGYNLAFKLSVAAAGVGLVGVLVATLARLRADRTRVVAALGVAVATPVALGAVVLNRYDLWPALLLGVALLALLHRRHRLGFGLLAAGCVVKIFPAVVLPVAALHVLRTAGRRAAALALATFAAVLVALAAPLALLAPGGFGFSLQTQLERQLQIESLGASVLLAADRLGLYAANVVPGSPGSIDLSGGLPDAVGALTTVAFVAALALVVLLYRREAESDELLVAGFAASVTAVVAFSKVVSPQFLVWLVPVVPLVAPWVGTAAAGLLVAVMVATQVEVVHEHALRAGGWPVWVLLARNLALVGLFALLVHGLRVVGATPAADAGRPATRPGSAPAAAAEPR